MSNDVWIYHYGVKGMKWGVRRDIAAKAKRLAIIERDFAKNNKKIEKMTNKLRTKGLKPKEEQKLKTLFLHNFVLYGEHDKYLSGLSEKDIRQGKRAVKALGLLNVGLSVGNGIREVVETNIGARANKALERDKMRKSK